MNYIIVNKESYMHLSGNKFTVRERISVQLLSLIIVLLYIMFTPIRFVLRRVKPELFKDRTTTNLFNLLEISQFTW